MGTRNKRSKSFETDSWGFGCSIVEMLTGTLPWIGKSVDDDMYKLDVKKQEKPHIPTGLSLAVENVIIGCFEYDFRSCPIMADILLAFKSLPGWSCDGTVIVAFIGLETLWKGNYSEFQMAKPYCVGQFIRLK